MTARERLRDWLFLVRCLRRFGWTNGLEVWRTINPNPPPQATVDRLRRRVLSGDWTSSNAELRERGQA